MTSLSPNTSTAMIMAGGTGGHIFPGLAVAKELIEQGWNVTWLGSINGMEERLVTEHGIEIDLISVTGTERLKEYWVGLRCHLLSAKRSLKRVKTLKRASRK